MLTAEPTFSPRQARRRIRPRRDLPQELRAGFAAIRAEFEVPEEFPPEVEDAAARAAQQPRAQEREDLRQIEFVTIDPPESRDLDQAFNLERIDGGGWRVRYAIADVAAFVSEGDPVAAEARKRGETIYIPDMRAPLYPAALGEDAASLMPGLDRPVALWTIELNPAGEPTSVDVRRALVRSVARLEYGAAQALIDRGEATGSLALLPEVGEVRAQCIARQGGFDLPLPDQEIEDAGDGWKLVLRAPSAIEEHNSQLSILTGICAARLMLDAGIGLLRTLAPPAPEAIARLRAAAGPLGVEWPNGAGVGELIGSLDVTDPGTVAFVEETTTLLRGAGYVAFDGAPPEQPEHGGIGAPYAHVTAPLRRLGDRAATEICLAASAGSEVPDHDQVRRVLGDLPEILAASARRAGTVERASVDLVEATLLRDRVGETFRATVVEVSDRGAATVMIPEPPVRARCEGKDLAAGMVIDVRLSEADPARRLVRFTNQGAGTAQQRSNITGDGHKYS